MSDILRQIIVNHVYKEEAIQVVSKAGGKPAKWILDFKGQSLRKDFLAEYARDFWQIFASRFPKGVQIGGMESGAISLIAGLVAFAPPGFPVNAFYIRKSRKKSDLANLLEGELNDRPIVLVDDILNVGNTVLKEIKILEDMGKKTTTVFVCVRYRDRSFYRALTSRGIDVVSIFELDDFRNELPVHNLVETMPVPAETGRYQVDYRIRLTNRPNLYVVVPKSGPVLVGEYIYLGSDDGGFHCIRAEDGSQVWTYRVPFGSAGKYIFSTPAVYQDKVMFGAYDGNLYCLDRFTGKLKWVFSDADWIGSSPCVNERDGVVYIGLEFALGGKRGGVAAVDIETGKLKWGNYSFPGLAHASPTYNEKSGLVVCGSNDHVFYAMSVDTGEIVWQFQTTDEVKYGAVFDDARDLVIFGSMDGGVYVLSTREGLLRHRFDARFGFYSTPALVNGRIIIGSLDKKVYCFDLATGKTAWQFETGGRIFASPAVIGESISIGSNDGRLYEVDGRTGKALSIVQLTERIVNRVAFERKDGKLILYVATHAGELYKLSGLQRISPGTNNFVERIR
jgi:outer membrane protein assembly factor BamB